MEITVLFFALAFAKGGHHEVREMMVNHAREMRANAVIGVRYDATEIMDGVTEVLCYGTAVVVEPNAE
jgi:uncharacterized protein YbjQ (UPF0145 family)